MEFTTTLELHGRTATGVEVPDAVLAALGGGKRPAVVATVNGHAWRTTVGVMGGRSLVGLSAEVRAGAGVAAGDTITVDLVADTAPRVVEVPDDLAAALATSASAQAAFAALSFSNQRRHAESVTGAKKAETRAARVAKVVAELEG